MIKIFVSIVFCIIFKITASFGLNNNNEELFLKIENYFKTLNTLEADFIQIAPDGSISEGKFYLDLPGKLRFDYKKPNNLLITCQGFWVIVQDRKIKQTTNVPLNETPLSFFLNKDLNFKQKTINAFITKELGLITLLLKKNEKEGKLTLKFSENPVRLKKWIITDNFDNETSILMQNVKTGGKLSHLLFFPDDF